MSNRGNTESREHRVFSLIGANSSGFQGFRAQLFVFIGDHVHTKRKFVDICTLAAEIEDADLWVRYTTIEP